MLTTGSLTPSFKVLCLVSGANRLLAPRSTYFIHIFYIIFVSFLVRMKVFCTRFFIVIQTKSKSYFSDF